MTKQYLLISVFVASLLTFQPSYAQQQTENEPVIQVSTEILSDVLVQRKYRIPAEVVSLNHAQISAQSTGEIIDIQAIVGETVAKGASLIKLDCRLSELALDAAKTALSLARKEHKRSASLQKTQTIAEQQFNQARANLDQSRIIVKQSEIAVQNCEITAPFNGVVTQRQAQLGALASPGTPMVKLLQVDAVEVEVQLGDQQLNALRRARNIQFSAQNKKYELGIRATIPLLDKASNQISVRLTFKGAAAHPGSSGEITWQNPEKLIPVGLIVERDGRLGFFISEDQRARFVPLTNAQLGHPAALPETIREPGKLLVIDEGRYSVEDGSLIKIQ